MENQKTLIKFYADWCGPCQIMKPVVEKIAEKHNLALQEVNIDTSPDLAAKYGVRSIPTLVLVDGDEEVRYTGANTEARVTEGLGLAI